MKRLILDLDYTLTVANSHADYIDVLPRLDIIEKVKEYKNMGFSIVISTARNMKTHNNSRK